MISMNRKGFTLIELLAVVVIMGILMGVAIPAVSKVVEKSRKDAFVDTAKKYGEGLKRLWISDSLDCNGGFTSSLDGYTNSRTGTSYFYVPISSKNAGEKIGFGGNLVKIPRLLESGGKSAWGDNDVTGYGVVELIGRGSTLKVKYYILLVDGTHGIINALDYTGIDKDDIELDGASNIQFPNHINPISIDISKGGDAKETVTAYLCQGL